MLPKDGALSSLPVSSPSSLPVPSLSPPHEIWTRGLNLNSAIVMHSRCQATFKGQILTGCAQGDQDPPTVPACQPPSSL